MKTRKKTVLDEALKDRGHTDRVIERCRASHFEFLKINISAAGGLRHRDKFHRLLNCCRDNRDFSVLKMTEGRHLRILKV